MISAFKEKAKVKKGGILEIYCPELQPDTVVDVIILVQSLSDNEEKMISETKKYSVSDFMTLLKKGPKISLEQEKITKEWIHSEEYDNDLYR